MQNETTVSNDLQQSYNAQYANETAEWRALCAKNKAKNICDVTKGLRFGSAIEVGAGEGSILVELGKKNFASMFFAAEISDSGIESIRKKNIARLSQVVKFDGYTLPFKDKSFDIAILSHVLEHVEYERTLLRELRRVSNYQCIEVPMDYRYGVDRRVSFFLNYGHINVYTPTSFKFLLKTEGFTILKEKIGVWNSSIFLFGKKSLLSRAIGYGKFLIRKIVMATMPGFISHQLASSVTVLTKANETGKLAIMESQE